VVHQQIPTNLRAFEASEFEYEKVSGIKFGSCSGPLAVLAGDGDVGGMCRNMGAGEGVNVGLDDVIASLHCLG
jgi:hypothetical protein